VGHLDLFQRTGDALLSNRVGDDGFDRSRSEGCFARNLRVSCLLLLLALCLLLPRLAHGQLAETPEEWLPPNSAVETNVPPDTAAGVMKPPTVKPPVASELAITTMIPDGDYRLFSATVRCYAWTAGVEYDRHSWGYFLHSQFDYVVEAIPIMILSQPAVSDFWGNAKSPNQQLVPGISLSPFGFRLLWRANKAIRPYVTGKLGTAVFTEKAFSQNASYANFNVQADFGVLIKMSERVDLKVDPFVFFHVSNGYLAASNPGMDELATKFGINYHLGKKGEGR
jgi:Lipid A 3-O-deacylase (PagL)